MSLPINYGGPAFPAPAFAENITTQGMTLRDYFAGQALAGMYADRNRSLMNEKHIAHDAYLFADAMLAAREASK